MLSRLEDELKVRPLRTLLARALYDNKPDYQRELSFEKGDVVTVLERNPKGYHGWWICSFSGQIGIAPGNYFEILGAINVKENTEESCYDDPAEWNLPSPESTRTVPTSVDQAVYENINFHVTHCDSVAKLTDSGNYSNRSSAFSRSLQSLTSTGRGVSAGDHGEASRRGDVPNCQSDDYEELDALVDLPQSPLPNTPITPKADIPERLQYNVRQQASVPPLPVLSDRGDWNRSASTYPWRTIALPCNLSGLLCQSSSSPPSSQDLDSKTEPVAPKKLVGLASELIWPECKSMETLIRFLQPILQNIDEVVKQVQNGSDSLGLDILRRLVQDLYSLLTVCSTLIDLSSENHELQLSFTNCHGIFKDASIQLAKLIPQESTSIQQKCTTDRIHDSIQLISTAIDTVATKVIRNASLLFSNANRPEDTISSIASSCENQTNQSVRFDVGNTGNPFNSLPTAPNEGASKNRPNTVHDSAQRVLAKLREDNRPQFDELCCQLVSLQTSGKSSVKLPGELSNSLKIYISRPVSSNEPGVMEENTIASSIIESAKRIAESTTDLLQKTSNLCSILRSLPVDDETVAPADDWRKHLESRGSIVHQNLTGLLIHTKSITQYVNHCTNGPNGSLTQHQVVPAPLIQRLIGSSSSVRQAITSLNTCLDSIVLNCEPYFTD